jgi:hypothetical protein
VVKESRLDSAIGIREVELGEVGIEYVRTALSTGGPLAQALHPVDLGAGIVSTFLPVEIRMVPERLQDEPAGLSRDGFQRMRQATLDLIGHHFARAEGQAWAMSEDRYEAGLGRFINARVAGRKTRFELTRIRDRGIFHLSGSVDGDDLDDFIEAASIHWNISALGVGGPLAMAAITSDWEIDILSSIPQYVRVIVCSAFDGEGLVFWGPRSSTA